MKRLAAVLAVCLAMMLACDAFAGNGSYDMWKHRKFIRIGYTWQNFNTSYGYKLDSKFGLDYTTGRSFFLHKEPLAGMMKFAIDFGMGADYVQYRQSKYDEGSYDGPHGLVGGGDTYVSGESELTDFGLHSFDLGLKVGPSLTINPYDNIRACVYFHFFPSASFLLRNTNMEVGFMPYLNFGLEVSYKWIGIGFETRNGAGRYWDLMDMILDEGSSTARKVSKYGLNSYNFYIAFRL